MKSTLGEPTVFVTYAHKDHNWAQRIMADLAKHQVRVSDVDKPDLLGQKWADALREKIAASDFLLVLLSPNATASKWMRSEVFQPLLLQARQRGIAIIPVLISDCEIPSELAAYQLVDLRNDHEGGVPKLVKQIRTGTKIDFSQLDAGGFERLVGELLVALGFKNVQLQGPRPDSGVDFAATFSRADPFGRAVKESWLVEVKFYRQSRPDVRSLQQLALTLAEHGAGVNGLLVTNGQLTSAARAWAESVQQIHIDLRIVDGVELRRLLMPHTELVARYFAEMSGSSDV